MANNQYINKVIYGNTTLLDLTSDTATADKVLKGYTFHDKTGASVTGTAQGRSADIVVTYSSAFYNKTITCTKGSTTYTQTTTSSGSTTFSVSDAGEWTITCNGISRTVNVVFNYALSIAITKTITLYSAVQDTVSFTDATGSKTCRTGNDGSVSVSITFIPPSQTITFTSSVAKNPDNLSAYYSKNINFSNSTSSVYLMPDNCLYWWGYQSDNLEVMNSTNGWTGTANLVPTFNTNNIQITSSSGIGGVASKTKVARKDHSIAEGISGDMGRIRLYSSKNVNDASEYAAYTSGLHYYTKTSSYDAYAASMVPSGSSHYLYALWYE